jgi:cell shape-determining protein MreC
MFKGKRTLKDLLSSFEGLLSDLKVFVSEKYKEIAELENKLDLVKSEKEQAEQIVKNLEQFLAKK